MNTRLVTIATFDQPFEADLAVSLLADAGIRAHQAGAYLHGMSSFFSTNVAGIRVQVPEKDAETARAVLAAHPDPSDMEPE